MNSQAQQIEESQSHLHRAKQLLNEIFPKTNDPRIFLGILELLKNTSQNLKTITSDPQLVTQINSILNEINHLLSTHQQCPTEIKTKEKIIMYTNEYHQKITITNQDLNSLISNISTIIIKLKKP